METSPTISELAKALCKAQSIMESVKKTSENPYFSSRYADLASVWDSVRKPLTDNGLCVIQAPEFMDGKVVVTTMLAHNSGEWVKASLHITPKDLSNPQTYGSIIQYFRRYCLQGFAGSANVDEDDDGEAGRKASEGGEKKEEKKEPEKKVKNPGKTTPGQQKYVSGLFSKTGYKTDSDQLNYAKSVVNHEVTDLNLLTFDECDLIIKTLAKLVA